MQDNLFSTITYAQTVLPASHTNGKISHMQSHIKERKLCGRCCFLEKMLEICWKALEECLIPQNYHTDYVHCSEQF